ncbi:MAG: hypothetical protein N3D09_03045 [Archaeoglobaceae archaeon]|nr:hypothetical protein [Archaeoglobaceae archaeon]
MFEDGELRALRNAVLEFLRVESEKEVETLKVWKKGLELGYFDLSTLKIPEASLVFSTIHEFKPELGYQLLYLSISNLVFGENASMCFYSDGKWITDWAHQKYVFISDDAKLIQASSDFLTTETFSLKDLKVIKEKKVNLKTNINVLMASRCVGTAIHAYNLCMRYLKEVKLPINYYHIMEKLGEILVEIKCSELLLKAVCEKIETSEAEKLSEMTLWKSAVTAVMAVEEAVLIQEGAYKYREDFKVEVFRDLSKIKHRNPKVASVYDLKVSEIYFPRAVEFYPKF